MKTTIELERDIRGIKDSVGIAAIARGAELFPVVVKNEEGSVVSSLFCESIKHAEGKPVELTLTELIKHSNSNYEKNEYVFVLKSAEIKPFENLANGVQANDDETEVLNKSK